MEASDTRSSRLGDESGQEAPAAVGYARRPVPRWVLLLALGVYVAWLGFLLVMVWVRMTDVHYMGL
jgi:hypothetical protein